jgi:predicted dehydrogenase
VSGSDGGPADGARPIGVGVIGLGFMGATHLAAYRAAHAAGFANRLVAVCDPDPDRRAGRIASHGNIDTLDDEERLFDPDGVAASETPGALLENPDVDLVSVCTYTDTHVDLALAALDAGKHVLVEKPLALRRFEAERLRDAARATPGKLCMPAMCMRFWPGWDWLAELLVEGRHGAVQSARFRRVGPVPDWAGEFYGDVTRSGGALFDLHVHDADFVRWCFGAPESVSCRGNLAYVTTTYDFGAGGPHVVAEGGWREDEDAPFEMGFEVTFEQAVARYEFGDPPVLTLAEDGASAPVELDDGDGYVGEVCHLLAAIAAGDGAPDGGPDVGDAPTPADMLDDAVDVTAMLEAELQSLEDGAPVRLA